VRQGLGLRSLGIAAKRGKSRLGAHCIYQARRQEDRCRSFERGTSVGDRAVAGLVSWHGAALGANCAEPSNAGVQDRLVAHSSVATNQPSKITAKGSSLSTRPAATGTGQPPARILAHLRPAPRSITSTIAKRRPVTLAVATHSLGVPPDTCVFSGGYSWFHLQCVFGVLWRSERGGNW
jgi:hypothetical protein